MYSEHLKKYIPPSFYLEKYNDTANIDLVTWHLNLSARFLGYLMSQNPSISVEETHLDQIRLMNEQNIEMGVMQEDGYGLFLNDLMMKDQAEHTSVVRNITYYELFALTDAIKTEELEQLYSDVNISFFPLVNQTKLGKLNEFIPFSDYYIEDDLSLVQIDFDCSDSEIKDAFSGWLRQEREKRKEESISKRREYKLKIFSQATFRKWHDDKVLAYIDLVTWNFIQGNKLTSKIIGDILFPAHKDLRNSTAMIDDTLKPLAAKLTDITTLKRMAKVFAEENRQKIT